MKATISVPRSADSAFIHVPPRLDVPYIEGVLRRRLGGDAKVSDCAVTNLCAKNWGGVSNSGATVLRLSLQLDDGKTIDLVAKILSPDSVNLFKIDRRFSSRLAEVAWAEWWGQQNVSWVPATYDTRADREAREFWIIQEYVGQVGWPGFDPGKPKGMGRFSADKDRLRGLLRQVAVLQAHSRLRIDELRSMFPVTDEASIDACPSQTLLSWLTQAAADASLLSQIGVTEGERAALDAFGETLGNVPAWVEQWDEVCVTADWGPDNFGIRDGDDETPVTFDWGTTRIAPMEEDIDVLLMRIQGLCRGEKVALVAYYLDVYADMTGRHINADEFLARIPWSRFLVTLRYLLYHIEALRWVPHQTRSRDFVHLFIRLCKEQSRQLPADATSMF